jgi:hypothetical protein
MRWLALALLVMPGCSGLKVEGDCTYVREVKTTYACETGGKAEHIRVTPLE